jgi:beta-glucanase (GH16 family)
MGLFMGLVCNVVQAGSCEVKLAGVVANLILIAGLISTKQVFAANILGNPGFESGSLSGWTTFGTYNYIQTSASVAHGGTYYYKVYGQFNASYNYTGIYQDIPSAPSNTYTADGWAYTLSSDKIRGQDLIWLEVSFRDASYNALALYRSVVVSSNNITSYGGLNTWFDLQITNRCSYTNASALILSPGTVTNTMTNLVAPAGTAYVRYQTVFRQGPDNANGSMYFDDLTLNQTGGTVVVPPPGPQWNIVWNDEFTQADGSSPDSTKWGYDIGNGSSGWGNNQLEYDTARTNNARIVGGQLVIEARQESYGGKDYTSARMLTKGKWSWAYGRMEARIKIPRGQGIWPAFWMLGTNIGSVGWPTCGEIDIMENIGKTTDQRKAHGTIHGPGYSGGNAIGGTYTLPGGAALADDFHIYAVEWTTNQIKWFMDSNQYFTATPASLPGGATWVFTQPQFFILNVAVGGDWPGNPDGTTIFPQQMLVDYVRVYKQTAPLAFSVGPQSNGSFTLSWPTNIVCHLQIQTNSLTGTWFDLGGPTNPFVVSPDPNNASVFYRLQSP